MPKPIVIAARFGCKHLCRRTRQRPLLAAEFEPVSARGRRRTWRSHGMTPPRWEALECLAGFCRK